jgi:hypothetical protein
MVARDYRMDPSPETGRRYRTAALAKSDGCPCRKCYPAGTPLKSATPVQGALTGRHRCISETSPWSPPIGHSERRLFSSRINEWYRRIRSWSCITPIRCARSLATDAVVLRRQGLCAGSCVFCFLPGLWQAGQPVLMLGRHPPVPLNLAYDLQSRISTGICVLTWLAFRWGEAMSTAQTTGLNFS